MSHRTRIVILLVTVLAVTAISGCDIALLFLDDSEWNRSTDPTLLAVTTPEHYSSYKVGEKLTVTWIGTLDADNVAIDLYRDHQWLRPIESSAPNTGEHSFFIPTDLDTATELNDRYQISVRGRHLKHDPGELEVIAYSEYFTITTGSTGGLTDVTVNQRLIVITVIDNGSEIDGDTVDIVLNGTVVAASHVLVATPGTNFAVSLQQGQNILEIVAINEGTIPPNTAQLLISNVTNGQSSQEWRLYTGETGSLRITAP